MQIFLNVVDADKGWALQYQEENHVEAHVLYEHSLYHNVIGKFLEVTNNISMPFKMTKYRPNGFAEFTSIDEITWNKENV